MFTFLPNQARNLSPKQLLFTTFYFPCFYYYQLAKSFQQSTVKYTYSSMLLCNKLLQNLVALKKKENHYYGHEFEQGKLRMACHFFKPCKAFMGIWLLAGGLSLSACVPFQVVSLCRLVWASSEYDGWVPRASVPRKRWPSRSHITYP